MPDFEFTDHSGEAKAALKEGVATALEAIGLQAEAYAKLKCPVDTGTLRNSISHAVSGDEVYIGTNVEYAPYQELGVPSRNIAAKHFLKSAAADHSDEYKAIAEEYLKA